MFCIPINILTGIWQFTGIRFWADLSIWREKTSEWVGHRID
jgi:hypothetical protein